MPTAAKSGSASFVLEPRTTMPTTHRRSFSGADAASFPRLVAGALEPRHTVHNGLSRLLSFGTCQTKTSRGKIRTAQ